MESQQAVRRTYPEEPKEASEGVGAAVGVLQVKVRWSGLERDLSRRTKQRPNALVVATRGIGRKDGKRTKALSPFEPFGLKGWTRMVPSSVTKVDPPFAMLRFRSRSTTGRQRELSSLAQEGGNAPGRVDISEGRAAVRARNRGRHGPGGRRRHRDDALKLLG